MLSTNQSSRKKIPLGQLLLPWRIARHLSRHGTLIQQFIKRDVLGRYRGAFLGIFWSLLRPLCQLAVFSVVFGYIFQSRWGHDPNESKADFTMALFCGLIVFEFIGECLGRAPTLVLANTNYVTKVVFPLEILPVSVVGAALVHLAVSSTLLCLAFFLVHGSLHLTVICMPLMVIPLIFLALGVTWLFASLGVFIRDINSFVPVLIMILMYASAIFYPISRVPPVLLPVVLHNPVAVLVDNMRNVFMWGTPLNWGQYGSITLECIIIMLIGYAFFMRTKNAFADVL
jgi:lipopolysaccharide transport system permease protein